MNTGEYYNAQLEEAERQAKKRRLRRIDLYVNWLAFVLLSLAGFWILLTDIDTYQTEKIFYRMVNDNVQPEEVESPYMVAGMKRNMRYKGMSMTAFFFSKWKNRAPIYLLFVVLPIGVAGFRAWRYGRVSLNWAYYPLVLLGFAYFIYFYGRWHAMW